MDKYLPKALLEEGDTSFFHPDKYIIVLLCMGVVILITALLPRILSNSRVTSPMIYIGVGILLFLIPVNVALPTVLDTPGWMKRFTEMGVIVALTGAGLKLNNPFSHRTWRISIRLLVITMPVTIAAIAFSGWWILGMLPASAVLFGAVLAPTDPVLAADVQTTPPDQEDHSETKLALTTEAGMNDGLAFPFTNMAIAMILVGNSPSGWIWSWLTIDFFYKIAVGFIGGYISGRVLAYVAFQTKIKSHLAKITTGILAMSLTLIPYGLTELAHGYGFIAVFVAACVFRKQESSHKYLVVNP